MLTNKIKVITLVKCEKRLDIKEIGLLKLYFLKLQPNTSTDD